MEEKKCFFVLKKQNYSPVLWEETCAKLGLLEDVVEIDIEITRKDIVRYWDKEEMYVIHN